MSQQQYNNLMSTILKEKCALAKLRAELEGQKGKICWCCKKFGHLAQNYRNQEGEEKRKLVLQNKFQVLSSRVMQCGVKERTIRRQEIVEVEYFKCGEKRHKCRKCSLWKGEKKMQVVEEVAHVARPQEAQQKEWRYKGTPPFPPLNTMTTLRSYLSLFTSDT